MASDVNCQLKTLSSFTQTDRTSAQIYFRELLCIEIVRHNTRIVDDQVVSFHNYYLKFNVSFPFYCQLESTIIAHIFLGINMDWSACQIKPDICSYYYDK